MVKPITPRCLTRKDQSNETIIKEINRYLKEYFELSSGDCCSISLEILSARVGIDLHFNQVIMDNILKMYEDEGWSAIHVPELKFNGRWLEFRIPPQEE